MAGLLVAFSVLASGLFAVSIWFVAGVLGWLSVPQRTPAGFAVPFVLIVVGLLLATRSLRHVATPLGDVMQAAEQIARGDYTTRVSEYGPREIRALAHAFNSMTARLQSSDEQRRNLLADVTHELRTPLTVIQGNLEGLIDGVYPRDEAHLTSILEETHILSRLIDDLRTLALAESGALKLQKEPVDLAILIRDTTASFRPQADSAGVELDAQVVPDAGTLRLDPARIRQVLENLLANALRYTLRGGRICVRCFREGRGDDARTVVSVADTGAGIAPDELPHIFERFYKSSDSRGTGLGLAIAKNLVTVHGGAISAQSEPDKGTTIQFSFPAAI
jgi:two-component system OmpR family sensor kinase/two-component system sensor histidine kinase BaeS